MRLGSRYLLAHALVFALQCGHTAHATHEKRQFTPSGWTRMKRLEPHAILPLRIGLAQSNIDQLEDILLSVSDPKSPNYGQHWSTKAIVNHFSPSQESVDAVVNWLAEEAGISAHRVKQSNSKLWLEVQDGASGHEVERLLKTEYYVWEHTSGAQTVGCHEYSIPRHVQKHVDVITPTVNLEIPRSQRRGKRSLLPLPHKAWPGPFPFPTSPLPPHLHGKPDISNCSNAITPICIQTLYNFVGVKPVETSKNTFGVVEFTPQSYLPSDLDLFFKNFTPSLIGKRPALVSVDGGVLQSVNQSFAENAESDLDLEYAMTLVDPQRVQLLQTGDLVEGAGFDNWLDAVDGSFCTFEGGDDPAQDGIYPDTEPGGFDHPESCGILKPPNVIFISYFEDEVTISAKTATRQCTEYAKLGLAGSSILYSSGDNGVAGGAAESPVCVFPNGTEANSTDPAAITFNPAFPASCPYVTAVGATQIRPNGTVFEPETAAATKVFSSGGFSNIFSRPSYQAEAVANYLKHNPPPYSAQQYNQSNSRGFPDISANGVNYVIACDGEFQMVFGTSASTPVWASILALINDARIQAGKGPVGFINPAIYSVPFQAGLHDITNGTNPGCDTQGFSAAKGWDPVTGLGTPNFQVLKDLFLALP